MGKFLGPPTGYTDLLDHVTTEKLRSEMESGRGFQKSPIRPSASGQCSRELFYGLQEFHGIKQFEREIKTPAVHRLLNLGHSVEYHVIRQFELLKDVFDIRYKQQVLSFAYLKAEKNPKLSQWLEGSLDLVLWSDKWKCVADVKSKKDKWSGSFKSDWDASYEKLAGLSSLEQISETAFWADDLKAFLAELRDPFFEANFKQLNLYCGADFIKERGIDHGLILQYCKNDSRMREIRFRPSPELYQETIQKFQNVITAVDTDNPELAPRDYVLGSMKCAFCDYKTACWGTQDARQAFFDTFPEKRWPQDTSRLGALGQSLEVGFEKLEGHIAMEPIRKEVEQAIAKQMDVAGLTKVRMSSGRVYELKRLKDSLVIRRSKA